MPRGDGTGPAGLGPRTGRAAGYCAGYAVPGYMNPVGFYGRGRGYRRMYYATGLPFWARGGYAAPYAAPLYNTAYDTNEEEALTEQLELMQEQIKAVQKRLDQLKKDKDQEE
ncbi:DUF5320 domain-containing protein [Mahella sp.]|uniref:DUF5320 domain-containing protein n=1 Tax=Mahella sp. TaxID=2798721 RepID=UPI0025BBCA02|nr:DUF5320 domain-containing protein [Mahella sp.]MBZ4666608.1 hypothetical protein [Mahella sp.]